MLRIATFLPASFSKRFQAVWLNGALPVSPYGSPLIVAPKYAEASARAAGAASTARTAAAAARAARNLSEPCALIRRWSRRPSPASSRTRFRREVFGQPKLPCVPVSWPRRQVRPRGLGQPPAFLFRPYAKQLQRVALDRGGNRAGAAAGHHQHR